MEEFLKTLSEELKRCMDRTGKEYFITQHVKIFSKNLLYFFRIDP